MEFRLEPLETISLVDKISKPFACEMSEDGRISLITENNIFVYTLMNYMNNEFGDMAFRKNVIPLPTSGLRDEFSSDLVEVFNNFADQDLYDLMAELEINDCLESANNDIKPLSLKWSPRGLCGSSGCVVAVLNNLYGLSIMEEYRDATDCIDYRCVANVTKYIFDHSCTVWESVSTFVGELTATEWKQRALGIQPIAYEWSHLMKDNSGSYAILFVAHPTGAVTSWKFYGSGAKKSQSEPLHFVGMYISSLKNISSLYWLRLRDGGALAVGNGDGNLAMIRVQTKTDILHFWDERIFGEKENQTQAVHITSITHGANLFIITVSDMFLNILSVQMWASNAGAVSYNTGTTAITGLCHFKDNMILLLTGEKLRKLTLNIENHKLRISEECVAVDFDWTTYKSYGIVSSKNRMFVGILAYPFRLKDITRHPTPTKFFFYYDASISPLEAILSNKDERLTEYWDYFEVLRLLSIKEKKFPWEGMKEVDYDKLTFSQLKSLRWISKLSEKVYNIVPKIKGYRIKPYILLHHLVTIQLVVRRMRKLLDLHSKGKQLSVFQLRSLDISNMFLKEVVMKRILEKCKVGERFLDDIINVMEIANELEYPDMPLCLWCGEKIIGPTCMPPHADSRCSISMMQIYLTPGFKCPYCKCVAHIEIAKEYDPVMCPYCDVPMYKRYSEESVQIALARTDDSTRQQMELSLLRDTPEDIQCDEFDGGVEGTEVIEDAAENDDIMILSESEEEEQEDEEEENIAERMSSLHKEFFSTQDEAMEDSVVFSDDQDAGNDSSDHEEMDSNDSEEESSSVDDPKMIKDEFM